MDEEKIKIHKVYNNCLACLSNIFFNFDDTVKSNQLFRKIQDKYFFLKEYPDSWWSIYGNYNYGIAALNHNEYSMLSMAIDRLNRISSEIGYPIAEGAALELQARLLTKENNFEDSLTKFIAAQKVFEHRGFKYFLAETHFQIGITYLKLGKLSEAYKYRDQAIQAFTNLEAPERVNLIKSAKSAFSKLMQEQAVSSRSL